MSYKKYERESNRYNEFKHAKIIAIVNKDGEIQRYDWTLTLKARDYFADPEDRKKYAAITVRPITCESMAELQEKVRVAMIYLRLGAALATPEAKCTMKRVKEDTGAVDWQICINDRGMVHQLEIEHGPFLKPIDHCPFQVSPWARGVYVDRPHLRVLNEELKTAEYKMGDRIQLCVCWKRKSENIWVTIEARHTEMWFKEDKDEDEDYHFYQDEFIGRKDGDGGLIQFNPKHVIQHLHEPQSDHDDEHIAKLQKWINSDPMSSESDCSDDEEPVLGGLVPCRITINGSGNGMMNRKRVIEMIEQQSGASPPESKPTPEPSDEAEQEQQAPPPEYIVPPQAPKLLRSRRRLPAGQPHQ